MKEFARLYRKIDSTTRINAKVNALCEYFSHAPDKDKLWAIALFTHRRPKRTIQLKFLRQWAASLASIPDWLFEESYHIVGDLAETISLVLPPPEASNNQGLTSWITSIIDQSGKTEAEKKKFIVSAWRCMDQDERFLFNKVITGGFRVGVSEKIIAKSLSLITGEEPSKITHRLMGQWAPQDISFEELLLSDSWAADLSKPYPFYLAYALDGPVKALGDPADYTAEYKWDGIRVQLIKRKDQVFLWSRGEELITEQFPEFEDLAVYENLDFVLDGELLVIKEGQIGSFNALQKRLGRKRVSKTIRSNYPVFIMAYDLLEIGSKDCRQTPLTERRSRLFEMIGALDEDGRKRIRFSPDIEFTSWKNISEIRDLARSRKAEGLMIKSKTGIYRAGRRKGDWWKWKLDPYTIDAVMIYAQQGHGRRSTLFTDFTFAVWNDDDELVPFAKAYSGLSDAEFAEITRFVKKNTLDRFGPVRSVNAVLVFEIAFEGIAESKRHKSGVALRFPRIKRWRKDKLPKEANTLKDLYNFLDATGSH